MAIYFEFRLGLTPLGIPFETRRAVVQRVIQRTLPSAPLYDGPLSGSWVDLRDAGGRVLYRQLLQDPWRGAEVPADKTGRLVQLRGRLEGLIRVLVPDLPGAATIVLMHSRDQNRPAVALLKRALPEPH